MAEGFNLSAKIFATLAHGQGAQLGAQVKSALRDVRAEVDVRISPRSLQGLADISRGATAATSTLRGLGAESARAGAAATAAGSSFDSFSSRLTAMSRRAAGFAATGAAFAAGAAGFRKGIAESIRADSDYNKLQQISENGSTGVRALREEVTRLATTFGSSSRQLRGAALEFAQAGFSTNDTKTALEGLAKASQSVSFGDIASTAQTSIALLTTFGLTADKLKGQLGGIDALSKQYATSAGEINRAISTTGGTFAALGGDAKDLGAIFTSVSHSTRQNASSIATGLNTIFSRLQRPEVVSQLEELGIQLRRTRTEAEALGDVDLEGTFVGPTQALSRIATGLNKFKLGDVRRSSAIEAVGSVHQLPRTLALVQNQGLGERARAVAGLGDLSLEASAVTRADAIQQRLAKAGERWQELSNNLVDSRGFRGLVDLLELGSHAAADLVQKLQPLIPTVAALASARLAQTLIPLGAQAAVPSYYRSPPPRKFKFGGVVPGAGLGDRQEAALEAGEFVLRREAAQRVGYDTLHRLNHYASGGPVPTYRTRTVELDPDQPGLSRRTVLRGPDGVRIGRYEDFLGGGIERRGVASLLGIEPALLRGVPVRRTQSVAIGREHRGKGLGKYLYLSAFGHDPAAYHYNRQASESAAATLRALSRDGLTEAVIRDDLFSGEAGPHVSRITPAGLAKLAEIRRDGFKRFRDGGAVADDVDVGPVNDAAAKLKQIFGAKRGDAVLQQLQERMARRLLGVDRRIEKGDPLSRFGLAVKTLGGSSEAMGPAMAGIARAVMKFDPAKSQAFGRGEQLERHLTLYTEAGASQSVIDASRRGEVRFTGRAVEMEARPLAAARGISLQAAGHEVIRQAARSGLTPEAVALRYRVGVDNVRRVLGGQTAGHVRFATTASSDEMGRLASRPDSDEDESPLLHRLPEVLKFLKVSKLPDPDDLNTWRRLAVGAGAKPTGDGLDDILQSIAAEFRTRTGTPAPAAATRISPPPADLSVIQRALAYAKIDPAVFGGAYPTNTAGLRDFAKRFGIRAAEQLDDDPLLDAVLAATRPQTRRTRVTRAKSADELALEKLGVTSGETALRANARRLGITAPHRLPRETLVARVLGALRAGAKPLAKSEVYAKTLDANGIRAALVNGGIPARSLRTLFPDGVPGDYGSLRQSLAALGVRTAQVSSEQMLELVIGASKARLGLARGGAVDHAALLRESQVNIGRVSQAFTDVGLPRELDLTKLVRALFFVKPAALPDAKGVYSSADRSVLVRHRQPLPVLAHEILGHAASHRLGEVPERWGTELTATELFGADPHEQYRARLGRRGSNILGSGFGLFAGSAEANFAALAGPGTVARYQADTGNDPGLMREEAAAFGVEAYVRRLAARAGKLPVSDGERRVHESAAFRAFVRPVEEHILPELLKYTTALHDRFPYTPPADPDLTGLTTRLAGLTVRQRRFAAGGLVPGAAGDWTDSVPMDLPVGSYVIRKASVRKAGPDRLAALAAGGAYASGGAVKVRVMPGEHIFTPDEARRIGRPALDRLNQTGRLPYAAGGPVHLAGGGDPEVREREKRLREEIAALRAAGQHRRLLTEPRRGVLSSPDLYQGQTLASASAVREAERQDELRQERQQRRIETDPLALRAAGLNPVNRRYDSYDDRVEAVRTAQARRELLRLATLTTGTDLSRGGPTPAPADPRSRFHIEALDTAGKSVTATYLAQTEAEAVAQARAKGLFVMKAVDHGPAPAGPAEPTRLGARDLARVGYRENRDSLGGLRNLPGVRADLQAEHLGRVQGQLADAIERQLRVTTPQLDAARRLQAAQELAAEAIRTNATITKDSTGRLQGLGSLTDRITQLRDGGAISTSVDGGGRGRVARFVDRLDQGGVLGRVTAAGLRGVGGLGSYLNERRATTGAVAFTAIAPYVGQALAPDKNAAEVAARTGDSGALRARSGAASAAELASVGAGVGLVAGPLGALFGGVVGGLVGFGTGLRQAARDLADAKIGIAAQSLADTLRGVAEGKADFSSLNQTAVARDIGDARQAAGFKAYAAVGGPFSYGTDPVKEAKQQAEYLAALRDGRKADEPRTAIAEARSQELRAALGNTAPAVAVSLAAQAQKLGRASPFENADDVSGRLLQGVGGDMVRLLADLKRETPTQVLRDYAKTIREAQQATIAARDLERGQAAAARTAGSAGRLADGFDHAAVAVTGLRARLEVNGLAFGAGAVPRLTGLSDGLSGLGSASPAGFRRSVGVIGGLLGDSGDGFRQRASVANEIERVLPELLTGVARQGLDERETTAVKVRKALEAHFLPGVPEAGRLAALDKQPVLADALRSVVGGVIGLDGHEEGGALKAFRGDALGAAKRLNSPNTDALKDADRIARRLEDGANSYTEALARGRNHEQLLGELRDRGGELRLSSLRAAADSLSVGAGGGDPSRFLTFQQLADPFYSRQQRLLDGTGLGEEDAAGIGRRLGAVRAELPEAEAAQRAAVGTEKFPEAAAKFSALSGQAERLEQALKNLVSPVQKQAAIVERLNALNNDRDSRLGFAEKYALASPQERGVLRRQQNVVRYVAQDPTRYEGLGDQERKDFLAGSRDVGDAIFPGGKYTGTSLRNAVLAQKGVLDLAREQERAGLNAEKTRTAGTAEEANRVLVDGLQSQNKTFLGDLGRVHVAFFEALRTELLGVRANEAKSSAGVVAGERGKLADEERQAGLLRAVGISSQDQLERARPLRKDLEDYYAVRRNLDDLQKGPNTEAARRLLASKAAENIDSVLPHLDLVTQDLLGGTQPGIEKNTRDYVNAPKAAQVAASVASYVLPGYRAGAFDTNAETLSKRDNALEAIVRDSGVLDRVPESLRGGIHQDVAAGFRGRFDATLPTVGGDRRRAAVEAVTGLATESLEARRGKIQSALQSRSDIVGAGLLRAGIDPNRVTAERDRTELSRTLGEGFVPASGKTLANLPERVADNEKEFAKHTETLKKAREELEKRLLSPSPAGGPTARVGAYAQGGLLQGGTPNKDSLLVMAMGGEFILRKAAVQKLGIGTVDYLNRTGQLPRFAEGGPVGDEGSIVQGMVRQQIQRRRFEKLERERVARAQQRATTRAAAREKTATRGRADDIFNLDRNSELGLDRLNFAASRRADALIKAGRLKKGDKDRNVAAQLGQFDVRRTLGNLQLQQFYSEVGDEGAVGRLRGTEADDRQRFRDRFGSGFASVAEDERQRRAQVIGQRQAEAAARGAVRALTRKPDLLQRGVGRFDAVDDPRNRPQFFANGGFVSQGPSGVDAVPSFLSRGEYVLPKGVVQSYGLPTVQAFANGGLVSPPDPFSVGSRGTTGGTEAGRQQREQQNDVLAGAMKSFAGPADGLASALRSSVPAFQTLAESLDKFPREVEMKGNHTVVVRIDGDEAFRQMGPGMQEFMAGHINAAIEKQSEALHRANPHLNRPRD